MNNVLKGIKYIDLFAGIGGFHQAFNSFGAECVFASEWNQNCQNIYEKNYGIKPLGDITKISEKDIPKHNILCAGFPCQAFSISGKQLGFADTRGTLFFDIARIAKYHQPSLIFLENVKNLAKHNQGKTLTIIKKTLETIGYDVFYEVLNSSYFGVPQKRERIYILGFHKDLKINNFPFPSHYGKPTKLEDFLLPENEVSQFIINRQDIILNNTIIEKDLLGNYPQKPIRIGIINKGGQGERIYSPLGHSITLSAYGGGVGAKTGLYLVNNNIRKLAPRECARITGFPESFILSENKNIAYQQLGNSVVINVLKAILEQIVNTTYFNKKNNFFAEKFILL
jgi:DNA (cytosine-5)-methyltransferase 1